MKRKKDVLWASGWRIPQYGAEIEICCDKECAEITVEYADDLTGVFLMFNDEGELLAQIMENGKEVAEHVLNVRCTKPSTEQIRKELTDDR